MATSMLKDPSFSKTIGTDRKFGEVYVKADRKQKAFMSGGGGGSGAKLNRQNTNHGKMDLPFSSLNKYAGHREGGTVKGSARTMKFAEDPSKYNRSMYENEANPVPYKKGGAIMAKDKGKKLPPWLMKKGSDDEGGGKAPPFGKKFAKGGGIESRGKTQGTIVKMAEGGAVKGFARGGGIEQRGKTRGKVC